VFANKGELNTQSRTPIELYTERINAENTQLIFLLVFVSHHCTHINYLRKVFVTCV